MWGGKGWEDNRRDMIDVHVSKQGEGALAAEEEKEVADVNVEARVRRRWAQ